MHLPNLTQWLNNGGVIKIQGKDIEEIWVGIGDPGGGTSESTVRSSEAAFEWAEAEALKAINAQLEVLEQYRSGQVPWPDDGMLRLPGIGVVHRDEEDV